MTTSGTYVGARDREPEAIRQEKSSSETQTSQVSQSNDPRLTDPSDSVIS